MKILPLIVLLGCVVWGADARPQEEGAAPARGGLLKRGLLAKGKQTTTTTTAAPQEEEYVDEAEYQDGEAQVSSEPPSTSTEGKKLVAGGVRPFRSNTDLLEALKRRRAQAAEAKLQHSGSAVAPDANSPQEAAAEAPAKANYSKKRFNNVPAVKEANQETVAPTKPTRARFGRPGAKSVPEPDVEEQSESAAPSPVRTGRTFRRGN